MAAKTYLVGGAIRDELLGQKIGDRDWVVTGATPQELLDQGYRQVGSSFPVYLHPDSSEEYALARTERKQGHGYHGFEVAFDPSVTIEDDLLRRDLTINAIARDSDGVLVDPFNGQADIEQKYLRHVSPAFAEDPLRVLRVARFAARFAHLGFRVHDDTLALMKQISSSGELDHLVAERCWSEIFRSMGTSRPSEFLKVLRACGALAVILPEVDCLFGVPQDERWHPEVDTGKHVCLAMDLAAERNYGANVVFALMLHDLGKGLTDENEWPAHHGHEKTGMDLVDAVCARLKAPVSVQRLAGQVCRGHLRCHRILEMTPAKVMKLLEDLDAFRSKDVSEFIHACEADYLGREGLQDRAYPQGDFLQEALKAALSIRARDLQQGSAVQGPALGEKLRQARIGVIASLIN